MLSDSGVPVESRPLGSRILIVSGIWPPDVGGPASHGPEVGRFLLDRGHRVTAVTMSSSLLQGDAPFPVLRISRDLPIYRRMTETAAAIARAARAADVVYATGMYSRAAVAARLRGVKLVIKLASDPAYDRMRNWGMFDGSLEDFQRERSGARASFLSWLRDSALSSAEAVIVPSDYLRRIALEWRIPPERVRVIPNAAPEPNGLASRQELRRRLGLTAPTAVFTGRFARAKNLPLAVAAVAHTRGVRLVLVGDGPERPRISEAVQRYGVQERVTLLPPRSREEAIEWLRAADAAILSSDWENLPHAVLEALAVGTPVVSTAVGGVPELVQHGATGLLVPPGEPQTLARALEEAVRNEELHRRVSEGAQAFASRYSMGAVFSEIAATLELAAEAAAPSAA
jgi:glycosyltransferase involved in cell wall biosynthesis